MHDRSKELASRKTGVNKTLEFLDSIESDIPNGKQTRWNAVGLERVCMYGYDSHTEHRCDSPFMMGLCVTI